MKTLLYSIGSLAIISVAFFSYRALVPPSFSIESLDVLKKSGRFLFGKAENNFSLNGGGVVGGYGGWALQYGTKDGKTVFFDLYHNGKFVKNIKTLI